jgi:transcriptional regulator NrdR family protein
MVCIYCGGNTHVINSRSQKRLNQVWRRRKCLSCDNITTSHEAVDLASGVRVELDGDLLQPFLRDKLWLSIYESCKHRPEGLSEATALTQTIIALLVNDSEFSTRLQRKVIIKIATVTLQRFDAEAAAIYGAYHRA